MEMLVLFCKATQLFLNFFKLYTKNHIVVYQKLFSIICQLISSNESFLKFIVSLESFIWICPFCLFIISYILDQCILRLGQMKSGFDDGIFVCLFVFNKWFRFILKFFFSLGFQSLSLLETT